MANTLVNCIDQTFILAHQEVTDCLEQALTEAGCCCQVLRQIHRRQYQGYSRSFLCLLNHRRAWERARHSDKPTLIVEADFVPVQTFGQLPPSFDPEDPSLGIAWLYTCAPQVYRVTPQGYGIGYSTSLVAYVITAASAVHLLEVADGVAQDPGPSQYSPWDSGLDYSLRDRNFTNYVPFRNYGEHGGLPNPEHHQHRLSRVHRADVLYGPLAFPPLYAQMAKGRPGWLAYGQERLYGRSKGMARLMLGKYLRLPVWRTAQRRGPLAWFALSRQLTWQL